MEAIYAEIIGLLSLIIVGVIGYVAKQVTKYLDRKGIVEQIKGHKELADIVVNGIEQTYKHLKGEEKLSLAKFKLIEMANEKGIKVSEKEIDLLLENAVKSMKDGIKSGL